MEAALQDGNSTRAELKQLLSHLFCRSYTVVPRPVQGFGTLSSTSYLPFPFRNSSSCPSSILPYFVIVNKLVRFLILLFLGSFFHQIFLQSWNLWEGAKSPHWCALLAELLHWNWKEDHAIELKIVKQSHEVCPEIINNLGILCDEAMRL